MTIQILVVDDSKLARMAVSRLLAAAYPDWTRIEAANADEALALLKEPGADIALVDFNMPGRSGIELAIEFRSIRPDMPVAVISANHQQEVVERTRAAGATFLAKPLDDSAFREFLHRAAQLVGASRS